MVRDLLKVSRPFSWINTALPFLVMGLATSQRLSLPMIIGSAYFLLPYNLLLYGVNDLFDYESDRLNPRKGGAIEGGLVAPQRARLLWAVIALTNAPLLLALILIGGRLTAGVLAITVLVALAYSAPPLRTKVIAGLDSLTSALHFVLPAVCGGIVAGAPVDQLPWRFLLAFLLWGVASQALGSLQDVRYDRAAGIGSVAAGLGERRTAALSTCCYLAAAFLVASAGGPALLAAAALLPYVVLGAACLSGDPERRARWAWRSFLSLNLLTGLILSRALLQARGLIHGDQLAQLAWLAAVSAAGMLVWRRQTLFRWQRLARLLLGRPLALSLVALAGLLLVDVLPFVLPPVAFRAGDEAALAGALVALALFLARRLAAVRR